ncbi:MAG: hypothetical protein LBH45_07560 [Campylobacteraceae bacterium]|jgi:hypothetical protein|nr:hypothetical protein [Campylobacteraceae bacterium]
MKNIIKLFTLVLLLGFLVGCGGGSDGSGGGSGGEIDNSQAGEISGLGLNYEGEVYGTPYNLPQGVSLKTDMRGLSWAGYLIAGEFYSAITSFSGYDTIVGSGGAVALSVEFENLNSVPKEVVFPAGLIIKPIEKGIQNGILLKETRVTIPANTNSYKIILVMYCANLGIPSSWNLQVIYDGWVVTNSSLIQDLINRLKNKKINIEEYSSAEVNQYDENTTRLASILWKITNGMSDYGLLAYEYSMFGRNYTDEEDILWIEQLQNSN